MTRRLREVPLKSVPRRDAESAQSNPCLPAVEPVRRASAAGSFT